MSENSPDIPPPSRALYNRSDAHFVMKEIATHIAICTRAWIGLGEGRVILLKDETRNISTHYDYEDGIFTFHDKRGGRQKVKIEEITEIAGF